MLVKTTPAHITALCLCIFVVCLCALSWWPTEYPPTLEEMLGLPPKGTAAAPAEENTTPASAQADFNKHLTQLSIIPQSQRTLDPDVQQSHHQIFSATSATGSYFPVKFGSVNSANVNFIPHWEKPNTWITVAQKMKVPGDNPVWNSQLMCDAYFDNDGVMTCEHEPVALLVPPTQSGKCEGDVGYFSWNIGPHDARLAYGPDRPFLVYGSNSRHNCFGIWAVDARMTMEWDWGPPEEAGFRFPVDLQRPPPYRPVEKNYFLWWDMQNMAYLHHDVWPHRVFAKLEKDGSVGTDLGYSTRLNDDACIAAYVPKIPEGSEDQSIHQGTNSVSVTMCKRSDPTCKATDANTYVLHIFQYKTFYYGHPEYEPYVMLFNRVAPFQLHSISSKPLWVTGRKKAGEIAGVPDTETGMIYITSINWRDQGLNYHGYLDDMLMIGHGIEDKLSGGMDILAEDLLDSMALCGELNKGS